MDNRVLFADRKLMNENSQDLSISHANIINSDVGSHEILADVVSVHTAFFNCTIRHWEDEFAISIACILHDSRCWRVMASQSIDGSRSVFISCEYEYVLLQLRTPNRILKMRSLQDCTFRDAEIIIVDGYEGSEDLSNRVTHFLKNSILSDSSIHNTVVNNSCLIRCDIVGCLFSQPMLLRSIWRESAIAVGSIITGASYIESHGGKLSAILIETPYEKMCANRGSTPIEF